MIKQPHLNAQYNNSMGGVDPVDKPGTSKTVWYLTNWKIQLAGLLWLVLPAEGSRGCGYSELMPAPLVAHLTDTGNTVHFGRTGVLPVIR